MSSTRTLTVRLVRGSAATRLLAAALAAVAVGLGAGAGAAPARDGAISARALAFHDAMRALWESHGTWTERAIVDFVGGLPDTPLVIGRLLQNQTDIGNAVKPYYGQAGGNQLTALLKGHINAAVAVLKAAEAGNSQAITTAKAAFYANGDKVAAFLHTANPRQWSLGAMKTMMRIHLNQVIALAVDQLQGHYAAAVRLYDRYIAHILDMADMLSTGIMQQFPSRF